MRQCIRGLAPLLAGMLAALSTAGAGDGVATLTPTEAAARPDLVVIDVREPYELSQELGAIEGAVNVPLGRILLGQGLDQGLDKSAPILMVCRSGSRSARAAERARAMGFTNVYSLDGGMLAWNEEGLAVTRTAAEADGKAKAEAPAVQIEITGVPCG